jgi:membrane protease YdiL (CAAX protease family)
VKLKARLAEAVFAYVAFIGISAASRLFMPLFVLVMAFGLAFPLLWAKFTRNWASIGFTAKNSGQAFLWGSGAGLLSIAYTVVVFGHDYSPPPLLGIQIAVGIPIWLLIMSPFQEFFFRGWLQPRFQEALGKWGGLLVTSAAFTLWHFAPPLEGTATSSVPVTSIGGFVSCFGLGLLFGYVYQRTGSIIAPWLAHALAGIALIIIGLMSFVQYVP